MLEGKNINLRIIEKQDLRIIKEWTNDLHIDGEYSPILQETINDLEKQYDSLKEGQWYFIEKKEGTKIGPQVNIGHNSAIGKNCQIAGRTHISGSVKIGNSSKLWANCTIKDGISIGNNCTVGIGAIVTKDIESDITVMGLEALKLKSLVKFKKDSQYK